MILCCVDYRVRVREGIFCENFQNFHNQNVNRHSFPFSFLFFTPQTSRKTRICEWKSKIEFENLVKSFSLCIAIFFIYFQSGGKKESKCFKLETSIISSHIKHTQEVYDDGGI
jgi:hypothetical protein